MNKLNSHIMNEKNRFYLAIGTMTIGLSVIVILAILMVMNASEGEKTEAASDAFNTIVPLIGTWIGAIIAFYYGRENFEAAQKQIQIMLDKETLDDIQVKNIMIHTGTMVSKTVEKDLLTPLKVYRDFLVSVDKSRLPLLDEMKIPKYILHKSAIDSELLRKEDATLKTFLESMPKQFGYNEKMGFIVVAADTKLETALKNMRQLEGCKDIFVTDNGLETGKVIGWVTDTLAGSFLDVK